MFSQKRLYDSFVEQSSNPTLHVTLQNVGNVSENVIPTLTLPPGVRISDFGATLSPVTLAVGQAATQQVHLLVDSSVPLHSTLTVTVTAAYGSADAPLTQRCRSPCKSRFPAPACSQMLPPPRPGAGGLRPAAAPAGRPARPGGLGRLPASRRHGRAAGRVDGRLPGVFREERQQHGGLPRRPVPRRARPGGRCVGPGDVRRPAGAGGGPGAGGGGLWQRRVPHQPGAGAVPAVPAPPGGRRRAGRGRGGPGARVAK